MRVLSMKEDQWGLQEELDVQAARGVEQEEHLTWLRLERAKEEDLKAVIEVFEVHPLAVEELEEDDARPVVEDYPDVTFCLLPVPDYKTDAKELDWEEVAIFLAQDFVLTVSTETIQPFDQLERRLIEHGLSMEQDTLSHLFYQVVDTVVDSWFPFIEALEKELDELEEGVLASAERAELDRIRDIKRLVTATRKVTLPMRDVVLSLERDDHPNVDEVTTLYLRHTSDRMKRVVERLDFVKEMALIAQDTWNATLANEQNHVMKRLTVVAGLLLLPTLIASLGGMNFQGGFPAWNFWWVTAAIFVFISLGITWAWRRGVL